MWTAQKVTIRLLCWFTIQSMQRRSRIFKERSTHTWYGVTGPGDSNMKEKKSHELPPNIGGRSVSITI